MLSSILMNCQENPEEAKQEVSDEVQTRCLVFMVFCYALSTE